MNEISIRKATVEDAGVIHNLLSELEKTLDATQQVKRTLADLEAFGFSGEPCFEALIAWKNATAVGLVLFFKEFSTWRGVPGVYVQDLYVAEDFRGSGLGSMLMKAVFEHTRDWSAQYCRLSVHTGNETAMAFYQRLGFKEARNEHVFVLDGL